MTLHMLTINAVSLVTNWTLHNSRGFLTRMVYLHYISCLRSTILVGNPRVQPIHFQKQIIWVIINIHKDSTCHLLAHCVWTCIGFLTEDLQIWQTGLLRLVESHIITPISFWGIFWQVFCMTKERYILSLFSSDRGKNLSLYFQPQKVILPIVA